MAMPVQRSEIAPRWFLLSDPNAGGMTLREILQQLWLITKCALQKNTSTVEYRHTASTLSDWH